MSTLPPFADRSFAPTSPSPLLGPKTSPKASRRGIRRPLVAQARRVVINLGTRVLVDDEGRLVPERLSETIRVAAQLHQQGRQVILVSSGAVGLGREVLGLIDPPTSAQARRACAAIGQSRLVGFFQQEFSAHGLCCGQVLLTEEDFDHRRRYLDLRATLEQLLASGVIPILNENDAVSHGTMPRMSGRCVFSDNDRLAALVAAKCDADLLILLTDVAGVFDRNPQHHLDARLLEKIEDPGHLLDGIDDGPGSTVSRGGMRSKVDAARIAARGGCHVVIASGRVSGALRRATEGRTEGTWFPALGSLPARRRWIAYAAATKGVLHLDAGAVKALRHDHASLLPVGVGAVEGSFDRGDVVELRGPEGELIGRGLMSWNAEQTRQWCSGHAPSDGLRQANCLLRRTHVVLES